MNVIVAGVSEVTTSLLKRLDNNDNDITVVGNSENLIDDEDVNVSFVDADFCDISAYEFLPKNRELNDYFFLAASNDDAKNVVASMIATKLGIINIYLKADKKFYVDTVKAIETLKNDDMVIFAKDVVDQKLERLITRVDTLRSFTIDDSDIEIINIELVNRAIVGSNLINLAKFFDNVKYRIFFIERDGEAHVPNGDFKLQLGDNIYFLVKTVDAHKITNKLGFYSTLTNQDGESLSDDEIEEIKLQKRKILFLGNPENFMTVASRIKENFDITICIKSAEEIIPYGEETKDFDIIEYGDNPTTVVGNYFKDLDVFVASTDSDEINFITAQIAKESKIQTVITFAFLKEYLNLYSKSGIDRVVSYSEALVNEFTNKVTGSVMMRVDTQQNDIMMNKFTVEENSKLDGRKIMEHKFPSDMIFGIVKKGEELIIPTGLTVLEQGDVVTMILLKENEEKVEKYFKEKKFLGVFR